VITTISDLPALELIFETGLLMNVYPSLLVFSSDRTKLVKHATDAPTGRTLLPSHANQKCCVLEKGYLGFLKPSILLPISLSELENSSDSEDAIGTIHVLGLELRQPT
jgi:hypothetical protein